MKKRLKKYFYKINLGIKIIDLNLICFFKKVSETIQSFQTENDKMINEFHRSKHKIEKEITKSEKIATKRNSLVVNEDIKLNYKNQIDAIDIDLATNVQILEQKLIREVQNIYIEMYKQIKIVQVASLDPV